MKKIVAVSAALFSSSMALASQGLVVHTAEFGVGKFHRYDNQVHAYDHASAWFPYILPQNAATDKPLTISNADGSVTVFFSTLDDLLTSVIQISKDRHQPVSVLNVHGHGLPGTMWFPADANVQHGWACGDWNDAASGSDQSNYNQYYSAVSPDEIREIRQVSDNPDVHQGCTTGLDEWKAGLAKFPQFKSVMAADAQIHFLSCVVGMGSVGQDFTQGIAQLLLPAGGGGRVETSMDFGLGDWSMPEGMGFWDLQTDAQVEHDNDIYGKDKKDREIAQKGTIRMVTYATSSWQSTLLANRDFLPLSFELGIEGVPVTEVRATSEKSERMPVRIRVPGTNAHVYLK